mmetsp:Transcript_9602/g.19534  ORF Transcript_9602/g.19534 Transcript_9602/m.19534 type:complete len:225 (+) Transcript_9602:475-1149(+)
MFRGICKVLVSCGQKHPPGPGAEEASDQNQKVGRPHHSPRVEVLHLSSLARNEWGRNLSTEFAASLSRCLSLILGLRNDGWRHLLLWVAQQTASKHPQAQITEGEETVHSRDCRCHVTVAGIVILPIRNFLVIRVDPLCGNHVENERSRSKASNDKAAHHTLAIWQMLVSTGQGRNVSDTYPGTIERLGHAQGDHGLTLRTKEHPTRYANHCNVTTAPWPLCLF